MQSSQVAWLAVALISFLASLALRARRWGTLLGVHRDPGPFRIRHCAVFIGFAGNCVLPAHAGELARAVILHRFARIPLGAALGSIVAERFLDVIVVLLFLLTPLLTVDRLGRVDLGALRLGWITATALVVVCSALLMAARSPASVAQFAGGLARALSLGRFAPRLVIGMHALLSGLDALRNPRHCTTAVAESIGMWGLVTFTYWTAMLAFGITSPGLTGALFVGAVATLGIAIPSSPGYFGPFEAALRFGLGVYAVPPDIIVAYALTLRLLIFVGLTTIGLVMAVRLGLSFTDFAARAVEASRP